MNFDKIKQLALSDIDARGWAEIIVVSGMAITIWIKSIPHQAPVNEWHATAPAKVIDGVGKQAIAPPKVIYVYLPAAKEKLDLPAPVQSDPNEHVLQASDLPISDHPQEIVCTQNSNTGESALMVKEQPLPWLAAENKGEVRLDYGIKNGTIPVLRASIREDLIQVKSLHAGVNASVDSDSSFFAGGSVGYKF